MIREICKDEAFLAQKAARHRTALFRRARGGAAAGGAAADAELLLVCQAHRAARTVDGPRRKSGRPRR